MSSVLEALRANTRLIHDELEELLYGDAIRSAELSKEEIIHLLQINFYFFNAIEKQLEKYPELKLFQLNRAKIARRDLLHLNHSEFDLLDPNFFEVATVDEMLGYLYVALGSSLGGMVIHKAIERNPKIDSGHLAFYKDAFEQMKQWKLLKEYLTDENLIVKKALIVDGAVNAFRNFKKVFQTTA